MLFRSIKTAFEMRPDFRVIERQYLRQKSLLEKARLLRRPDLSALAKWGKQGRGFSENEAKEMNDKSVIVKVRMRLTTMLGRN